jgi:hypothetical protein
LNSTANIIIMVKSRMVRRAGHVARTGEKNKSCTHFKRKPEGKTLPGRTRRRREFVL